MVYKRLLSYGVTALVGVICIYAVRLPRVYQAQVICHGSHSTQLLSELHIFFADHCNQSSAPVLAQLASQFPILTDVSIRHTAHQTAVLACSVEEPSVLINDHHLLTQSAKLVDACWYNASALARCIRITVDDIQTAVQQAQEIVQFVHSFDAQAAPDYAIHWKHKRDICLTHRTKPLSIIARYDMPLDAPLLAKVHAICTKKYESQGHKKPQLLTADVRFEQQVVVSPSGRRG